MVCASFCSGLSYSTNLASVTLLHEHSQYYDTGSALRMLFCSQRVVYTSEFVKKSWKRKLNNSSISTGPLFDLNFKKLPQPIQYNAKKIAAIVNSETSNVGANDKKKLTIVAGGHLQPRKGAHLYINLCEQIATNLGVVDSVYEELIVYWVGFPANPTEYSLYIESLMNDCSERVANISFEKVGLTDKYMEYFQLSDICICPSTCDPLPNIVYDAMALKKPIMIFKDCNGHEEVFGSIGCEHFLLDKSDIKSSAKQILSTLDLITDEKTNAEISRRFFKYMPTREFYAKSLLQICDEARQAKQLSTESAKQLDLDWIDKSAYLGYLEYLPTNSYPFDTIHNNLRLWGISFHWRNPYEAASEFISFLFNSNLSESISLDKNSVCVLGSEKLDLYAPNSTKNINYDLHIHAYYPDVAVKLLLKLSSSKLPPRFIHITSPMNDIDANIQEVLENNYKNSRYAHYQVDNVGRNISPLLHISNHIGSDYLLHLHTKASLHTNSDIIMKWTEYLESLLIFPQDDLHVPKVINFMSDNNLGVAYPVDPNKQAFGINFPKISELLDCAISASSKEHSDTISISQNSSIPYPCGFMLYFSSSLLRKLSSFLTPLINNENCLEPLPYDGTILHAIERFVPLFSLIEGENVGLLKPREPISR